MTKKKTNGDQPTGKLTRVPDFLPPPEELVLPDETVKVTLSLTRSSVEFFKREARKNNIKYQKMIRELVDRYAKQY
ncbi:MAG: CopG family transcriptional regulator [Candidatus Omnitrophota bacterium]|nr:CopG family transcriptional regulator [Candidatus Omnitrophota bacterium]